MMWTGELYYFYSDSEVSDVFKRFKLFAESIGYQFEEVSFDDSESLFFFKDKAMSDYHLEKGYNTDMNGLGCFSVEAQRVKSDFGVTLDPLENCESTHVKLVFNDLPYYVLVLPGTIEESEFSKMIYDEFNKLLKKDSEN